MNLEAAALAALRRSDRFYAELVSQRESFAWGDAFIREGDPQSPFNHAAELQHSPVQTLLTDLLADFATRGARCAALSPGGVHNDAALTAALAAAGFLARERSVFWCDAARAPTPRAAELRILPARAMPRAHRALLTTRAAAAAAALGVRASTGAEVEALVRAHRDRLDSPSYDAYVALRENRPAGMAALFQVGDMGRVCDVYTMPDERRQGVATALIDFAIIQARRWMLRPIVAAAFSDNAPARGVLSRCGFHEAARLPWFGRAGVAEVWE